MKKWTKISNYAFIVFALISVITSTFIIKEQNEHAVQLTDSVKKYKSLINNIHMQYLTEDNKLDTAIKVEDINGKKYSIPKIIKNNPKLIIRYKRIGCTSCADEAFSHEIKNFEKLIDYFGERNVIILTSFNNFRELYVFKEINKIKCDVFNTSPLTKLLPLEENNIVYYFISDSSLTARLVYIPSLKFEYHVIDYFKIVKEKYFDN